MTADQRSRTQGTLLGLACGDALGRPVEFQDPERIMQTHGRVTDMLAHGIHRQPAGTITDDTEMALCIARSLAEHGTFKPEDIADRFVNWKRSGPFDIGRMTSNALHRIQKGESWDVAGEREWEESVEGRNAGNGSLMRCAPYAVAYRNEPDELVDISRQSSSITHADPRCQWSCALFNLTLVNLIKEVEQPLESALDKIGAELPDEVRTAVEPITAARHDESVDIDLENTGYVVTTLQAGLYHGLTGETAEDAIIDAVMMGGDADTIGAVAGAIAGARFGADTLPDRWVAEISEADELRQLATAIA